MPKNTKKKKDKAADFSKAKLKLGKGKQTPTNAVDTSFKARSIALPSQTIAHNVERGVPTTKRKLTLDDLVSHLKHYSAGVRKDAIIGLRELFENHPDVIVSSLSTTLSSCARIIGDEDASVRKMLLSFLGWLLPRVPHDVLVPHTSILLLFTTSAQTHIFPEIRIDATRFLDLFLEIFPEVVVEGWVDGHAGHGRRVLEGYLGVLSAGTAYGEGGDTGPVQATSTASVVLSPASKLVILSSLANFLSRAMSSKDPMRFATNAEDVSAQLRPTSTWYMTSAFASVSAFEAFDASIQPRAFLGATASRKWREEADDMYGEDFPGHFAFAANVHEESWSLSSLSHLEAVLVSAQSDDAGTSSGLKAESAYVSHLARTLLPTLVATFLDCAPTVFAPGTPPSETELQTVLAVARLARCLYGEMTLDNNDKSRSTPYDDLSSLLGHMAPYFPFTVHLSPTARRDLKNEQALQDINLIFCELTSMLMLKTSKEAQGASGTRHSAKDATHSKQASRVLESLSQRVSDYTVQLLRGESPGRPDGQSLGPKPITPATYMSLLPTIWALVNSPGGDFAEHVAEACIAHGTRAGSMSAVKRHTIDFIGRLILLETASEYRGFFHPMRHHTLVQNLREWLLHLPKTLWELGSSNTSASETILRTVLRLHQQRAQLADSEVMSQIRARLVPYFRISHPARGEIAGPFTKLPSSPIRTLVLDVAASLGASGEEDALDGAVLGVVDEQEQQYWVSVRRALQSS
ncbi:Ipi1-N domain-containing protein [Phanerochaete sordida]|uniref:Pre-rRNA-processing protein n=1 Tax=Phanerochaete sordida TaxID=48140 RepID=A0A9P3LB40_9APHY|nr:Ipi1-N domain-containing protein [Phanerochaete sordida]